MSKPNKPQYGNWVAPRLVLMSAVLAAVFALAAAVLCLLTGGLLALKIIAAALAAFFIACIAYFLYARRLFSPNGGNIQNMVLDLLVSHIGWDGSGSVLDIGCGSGALVSKLAKRFPRARITGLDYWGADWHYCQSQCEQNAALEGVNGRTSFVQGSASDLPFDNETFDLVVSNMTFHEVKDEKNKVDLIREALRVLAPGGAFAFQDLFGLKTYYGDPDKLVAAVQAMGVKEVHFENTSNVPFIPKALKLPFMLGTAGVLKGRK